MFHCCWSWTPLQKALSGKGDLKEGFERVVTSVYIMGEDFRQKEQKGMIAEQQGNQCVLNPFTRLWGEKQSSEYAFEKSDIWIWLLLLLSSLRQNKWCVMSFMVQLNGNLKTSPFLLHSCKSLEEIIFCACLKVEESFQGVWFEVQFSPLPRV